MRLKLKQCVKDTTKYTASLQKLTVLVHIAQMFLIHWLFNPANFVKWLVITSLLYFGQSTALAETSIVPPGVRAFVYHRYNAEIEARFGPNGVANGFNVNEKIGANVIAQADAKAASVIQRLEQSNPDLLNSLDLGTVNIKPDVRVKVDIFGGAFGVSKDFMLVGVVPYYTASTRIAGGFYSTDSFGRAAQQLRNQALTDVSSSREELIALAQVLEQLTPPTGSNVQGVLVNNLGYKPIGNWSGSGIGDMIFYGQVRPINSAVYKQGFKLGAEVPTGRTDDPDNIIDIPFGRGHFVTFAESLNDFYVLRDNWILALNLKMSYQWAHYPTYRLAPADGLPLALEKEQVYRKPGNTAQLTLHSENRIFSELYFYGDYVVFTKGKDKFAGSKSDYDYGNLEKNTDQDSTVGELGFMFSTAGMYTRNEFPLPFKLNTFYSKTLTGRNADKLDLTGLRFEMYF